MSKASKLYKVFMTAMIVAIAGMLLASGIIALQKSMKLNLSFNMNPNIFCRIDASIGDNTSYNTIFCNTPDNATIGAGWSGNGNTLTFTNSSTDMVKTVYLKIWNHTETRVMIETTNHISVISAGTLATGTQGSEFSVSVPANGTASLDFSQVFAVDVSGVSHATVSPESNVYTIGGTYYVKSGATPTFAIESSEHYDELDDVTVSSTAEKSFLNGVLTLSNITGDVVVSASPIALTYTITYYLNADDTTVHATQSVTYDEPYSIPTEPTRADYTFLGWATSSGATSATWEAGSTSTQTCSGNKDWYAVWQANNVTITFTSTTNNLQVNSINGTTITTITSLQMKKTETKNVVVTSSFGAVGYWSRTADYSVTSGSATISFDSLTGDLTITNPSGDVTIDVADHANAFKPWTYGTYVDSGASTVGTQVSYNTVYYPAFAGYHYVKFVDVAQRWILIGSSSGISGALPGTAPSTASIDLSNNEVLLLSETMIEGQGYDNNVYTGFTNYYSKKYGLYYQSDVRYLCRTYTKEEGSNTNLDMSAYTSYMVRKTIQTSWDYTTAKVGETYNSNGNVKTTDYMFLLAYNNTSYARYASQEYIITNYLETEAKRIVYSSSGRTSYWWLRAGGCDGNDDCAYLVDHGGSFEYGFVNNGYAVRPSFILDISIGF